jgi:hypothetical protein
LHKTLATGLILAFIGIGLMLGSNAASRALIWQSIEYNTNSWNLNCTLTGGDKVTFLFREHAMWVHGIFDESDDNPPVAILRALICITPISPAGDTTAWEYDLAVINPPSGQGVGASRLVGWAITKMNHTATPIDTSVMLDSMGNLTAVGGTVPFSGLYEAHMTVYPSRPIDQAPSYLGFFHNVTITSYPYTYLLPVGGATAAFGGTVSFLGVRSLAVRWNHIKKRKNRTEIK